MRGVRAQESFTWRLLRDEARRRLPNRSLLLYGGDVSHVTVVGLAGVIGEAKDRIAESMSMQGSRSKILAIRYILVEVYEEDLPKKVVVVHRVSGLPATLSRIGGLARHVHLCTFSFFIVWLRSR